MKLIYLIPRGFTVPEISAISMLSDRNLPVPVIPLFNL